MTVKIDVPASFVWVIEDMKRWNSSYTTGKFTLNFKDGGICGIEPCPYIKATPIDKAKQKTDGKT